MRQDLLSNIVAVILLAAMVQGITMDHDMMEVHEQNKFPEYFGRGYNVFTGNPLEPPTLGKDFRAPIFQITYNQKKTTSYYKAFFVPDFVSYTQHYSCTQKSKSVEIKGTQDYQNNLKVIASVEGGYNGGAFSGSFGLSTSYQRIQKETNTQRNLDYLSTTECTFHQFIMDNAFYNHFTPTFLQEVQSTIANNNWSRFVEKFGTHYLTEIFMGGRRVKTITLRALSTARMRSEGLDVTASVSASYMGYSGSASVEVQTAQKHKIQFEQSIVDQSETYVGGYGRLNMNSWVLSARQYPQPTQYKLSSIENLFDKIPNLTSTQRHQAKAGFSNAVKELNNRIPKPSNPNLPQIQVSVKESAAGGGYGGGEVKFILPNQPNKKNLNFMNLYEIQAACGLYVDSMIFKFSNLDQTVKDYSPKIGGKTQGSKKFTIMPGDRISSFNIYAGAWIDGFSFNTEKGRQHRCGNLKGNPVRIDIAGNERIVGYTARVGNFIDRLSLKIAVDTVKNSNPSEGKNTRTNQLAPIGGNGGGLHTWKLDGNRLRTHEIRQINCYAGHHLDRIQLIFTNAHSSDTIATQYYGGNGGGFCRIPISQGDRIIQIEIFSQGYVVDGIKVFTKNNSVQSCGRLSRLRGKFNFGSYERIVGIKVKSGGLVDALGFVTATNY